MKNRNKIISFVFSLFILLTSCIVPIGASDSSEAVDFDELYYSDFGDLPEPIYSTNLVGSSPLPSYDGTTLFEDMIIDYEQIRSPYIGLYVDIITNPLFFNVYQPGDAQGSPSGRIYVNKNFNSEIIFMKQTFEGELMHAIKVKTYFDDGSPTEFLYLFHDLTIDDIQGFSAPSFGGGLYCAPAYNVVLDGNPFNPGYTAEYNQVYCTLYLEDYDYANITTPDIYAIPTYAGKTQVRRYLDDIVLSNYDVYLDVKDKAVRRFYNIDNKYKYEFLSMKGYPNTFLGSVMGWINSPFENNAYGYSLSLDRGPIFTSESVGSKTIEYTYNFPKYYRESTSNIITYAVTYSQYNDYVGSDQQIADDYQASKEEYEKNSVELKEALEEYKNIPKPDVSNINININNNASLGISSLSDIFGIIFANSMIIQMLMISLTFVFVAYILFGKR